MSEEEMDRLTLGLTTKADKMRVLERSGVGRGDIARYLGVRYQQVRNTLEGDKRTGYQPTIVTTPTTEFGGAKTIPNGKLCVITRCENGEIRLPSSLMDQFGTEQLSSIYALKVPGGIFLASLEGLVERAEMSLRA